MKLFRAALLAVALTPLLAATCVTEFRQKGPAGPWVGEVVNTGRDPVHGTLVFADLFDATGAPYGSVAVPTCPSVLLPGESGAFEIFWNVGLFPSPYDAKPPLRAEITRSEPQPWGGQPSIEGLRVREVERNAAQRYVVVEVANDSAWTYSGVEACGVFRTSDGSVAEVGRSERFPWMLAPGQARQFAIFFNSIPNGQLGLFAHGSSIARSSLEIPATNFVATASRIVPSGPIRLLQVVGELSNPYPAGLDGLTVSARTSRSPAERIDAYTGCNGHVAAGAKSSVMLEIPLLTPGTPDHESIIIESIIAYPVGGDYTPPVSNVTIGPRRGDLRNVAATVHNPSTSWIEVNSGCFNLRSDNDALVGTAGRSVFTYIAPGGTARVNADVVELARATSADVIIFARATDGPPPLPVFSPPDF